MSRNLGIGLVGGLVVLGALYAMGIFPPKAEDPSKPAPGRSAQDAGGKEAPEPAPTSDEGRSASVRAQIAQSKSNMRRLLAMWVERASTRRTGRWPRYSGKNFVLSLVALGKINHKNPAILFSPGDPRLSADAVDRERYKLVTRKALKSQAESFDDLTSYAGRRNGDREYLITPDAEARNVPILADPHFARHGIVLLGHVDGTVTELSLKDAGMPIPEEDEPILGEDASLEILEALSDY